MPAITLPHKFTPRPYQLPVLRALDGGVNRAVAVWHRRAGKETCFVNYTIKRMAQRVGSYFYFFPTYAQAKKAVWEGKNKDGFPFLGHFPPEYVASRNETELKITTVDGSIFRLVGSDNIDSIMSTNPVGCVFAEYALQDPRAWDYMRPILRENGGWAIFDYTPRGKNHGYTLYQLAKKLQDEGDPHWFAQLLTIEDTGVLSKADIEAERREGMNEDLIQQEYYCSFEGVQEGSYFGREMQIADKEGRVGLVRHIPSLPVDTWWRVTKDDAIAIWFTQNVGRVVHLIDYYENVGQGLPHFAKVIQDRQYVYGTHNATSDAEAIEWGTGKARIETAANLGIKLQIIPEMSLADGIDAARSFISRCFFDREKTEHGRNALVSYHKTKDEKKNVFLAAPFQDWSAYAADAFRCLAVGHRGTQFRRTSELDRAPGVGGSLAWMAA